MASNQNPDDFTYSKRKIVNQTGKYMVMLVRVSDDEFWCAEVKRELTAQEVGDLVGTSYDTVKKRRERGHNWLAALNPTLRNTFYRWFNANNVKRQ